MNSKLDIGTSAYAQLLRVVSRFHETIYSDPESPTGLNQVRSHALSEAASVRAEHCCAESGFPLCDPRARRAAHELLQRVDGSLPARLGYDGSVFLWGTGLAIRGTNAFIDPALKFRAELLPL